ncbi:MAG: LEA type 2 family protein [Bacteroidota bacterium]
MTKKLFPIIFFLSLLSSCITLKEPEVRSIENLSTEGLLTGHPHISFDVIVYNPNSIGLTLSDFQLHVLYGKQSLADLKNASPYYAEPLAEAKIPMTIEPTTEQLKFWIQASISGFSQNAGETFNGTGSLHVKKFLFSRKINFRF